MIYTIGRTKNYERYLDEYSRPRKLGRTKRYRGGSVWDTREKAQRYADKYPGYRVYGVLAEWNNQTEPSKVGPWHDLLADSILVRLGAEP